MNSNKLIMRLAFKARNIVGSQIHNSRQMHSQPVSSTTTNVPQPLKDKETFLDAFPDVVDSLVQNTKISKVPEVSQWVRRLLEYNVTGGKLSRGLATVFAYESIEKQENITEESMKLVRTMGWCVELVQTYFLVVDDIIDGSNIRRGKPCWYTLPDVGLGSLNDALFLKCFIFELIKDNCENLPLYHDILDLFNESLLYTSIGQHLDYGMSFRNKNDYSLFTIERYNSIVKYKTAYYTFKLPIILGYLLANNADKESHRKVEEVCLKLGRLFQIQDDILDCFGNEKETSKTGTDIQEGKCSWLAVNALSRCNEKQRSIFTENYASKDPMRVKIIKNLFAELKLLELYSEEETSLYKGIQEDINSLPASHRNLFFKLLDMTYKRKK